VAFGSLFIQTLGISKGGSSKCTRVMIFLDSYANTCENETFFDPGFCSLTREKRKKKK
jgi:hypothetical protein